MRCFPHAAGCPAPSSQTFGFTGSGFRRVCRICIEVGSFWCSHPWLLIALEKGCGSARVTCSAFYSCFFIAIIAVIGFDFALICCLSAACSRILFDMLEKGFTENAFNKWLCADMSCAIKLNECINRGQLSLECLFRQNICELLRSVDVLDRDRKHPKMSPVNILNPLCVSTNRFLLLDFFLY